LIFNKRKVEKTPLIIDYQSIVPTLLCPQTVVFLVSGVWESAPDSCLLHTTFYKGTVLAIKPFIDVEKEQTAPLYIYSNSAFFVGGSAKISFAPGAGYPSYALIAVD